MSKKHTHKENKDVLIRTISITADDTLKKFILDNAKMRNIIRNDFVEEANKYKGDYNMYYDFKPRKFKTKYYNEVELPENRYDYYCVGLSEQVANDFRSSLESIRTKNKKVLNKKIRAKLGEYHYKKFDYNRYTFRVKLKPTIGPYDNVRTRLRIIDNFNITFSIRSTGNQYSLKRFEIPIKLNEPLYDTVVDGDNPEYTKYYKSGIYKNKCTFTLNDIKDISFKYECGKYFILLFIKYKYKINKSSRKYANNRICGIDTGIRHPITIYDGEKTYYIRMDDKTIRKIHYLDRRIRRLQHYRTLKYNYNESLGLSRYSNNTIKMTKKIRKLNKKITNIKHNWIRNICKQIATTYEMIVVDEYECPNANDNKSLPANVRRKINFVSRFHNMSYFQEFLRYDCKKYGCTYIDSPDDTTRTCSVCKHINPHLKLSDKNLICEHCGCIIERDENAAKNCYDYLFDNM